MAVAPATFTASALALVGIGLAAFAVVGDGVDVLRLVFGITLLVVAMLVAGAQALLAHAGGTKGDEA